MEKHRRGEHFSAEGCPPLAGWVAVCARVSPGGKEECALARGRLSLLTPLEGDAGRRNAAAAAQRCPSGDWTGALFFHHGRTAATALSEGTAARPAAREESGVAEKGRCAGVAVVV